MCGHRPYAFHGSGSGAGHLCRDRDRAAPSAGWSTAGSAVNINAIRGGELDFGVAQSERQFHAYRGTSRFVVPGRSETLRAVFSVHPEPFTVVARADAGIESSEDLEGKRMNVGNPGSGQSGMMEVVVAALGWTMDDFALASEPQAAEQSRALRDNNIAPMICTVGFSHGSIQAATTACESVLVNVTGPAIDTLIADNAHCPKAVIPAGMCRGDDEDVTTFGVGATFVTAADLPEEVVYQMVGAVFENIDQFRVPHPAFARPDPQQMASDGLSTPLHPGAERIVSGSGLIG